MFIIPVWCEWFKPTVAITACNDGPSIINSNSSGPNMAWINVLVSEDNDRLGRGEVFFVSWSRRDGRSNNTDTWTDSLPCRLLLIYCRDIRMISFPRCVCQKEARENRKNNPKTTARTSKDVRIIYRQFWTILVGSFDNLGTMADDASYVVVVMPRHEYHTSKL